MSRARLQDVERVSFKATIETPEGAMKGDPYVIVVKRQTRRSKVDSRGRERENAWDWETVVSMSTEQAAGLSMSITDMLGFLAAHGGDREAQ